MKRIIYSITAVLLCCSGFAQSVDTAVENQTQTPGSADTIVSGNFIIITNNKNETGTMINDTSHHYSININIGDDDTHPYRHRRPLISTNWLIFDLGFANVRDKTDYGSAEAISYLGNGTDHFTGNDLDLRNVKSSNVNIWLFMQKLNLVKQVINLKYGLGIEMYNYRYESNISYQKNPPHIIHDTISFSKNKLATDYVTIPFMVNINPFPNRHSGLSLSVGVSAGYLYNSRNKQISDERGKQKTRGDLGIEPWRLAYVAEVGLGPVRLYGSYSYNRLHELGLEQYPYAMGIRFSNW